MVVGQLYKLSAVVEALQAAYDKVGVERKVLSTDIKNYFNVKDAWLTDSRGKRCRGYEITSDLCKDNVDF